MTASVATLLRRRLEGTYVVDEWGHDDDLVRLVAPLLRMAWRTKVEGADHVPADGPVVLVSNRRLGLVEPLILAVALRRAAGRPVRFLGAPDVAPVGPALQRLGGARQRPDELASLLRARQLVVVQLARSLRARRTAGHAPSELLAPAVAAGAPVLPVAVRRRRTPALRGWRVTVGAPIAVRLGDDADDVAEAARAAVQDLLDRRRSGALLAS